MASLLKTNATFGIEPDLDQQPLIFGGGKIDDQLPVTVSVDDEAQCCTITNTSLVKLYGNNPLPLHDDGHVCRHRNHVCRVRLDVSGRCPGLTWVNFCVLEATEQIVVMTGREPCWAEIPEASCCVFVETKRKPKDAAELKQRKEEERKRLENQILAERAARRRAASEAARAQNSAPGQGSTAQRVVNQGGA
ncbi:hypothetical protein PV08_01804 [Exophiala spinifera]|uniref:Uncharacterized protein n=1 Tax=Exophiala spinifera TaxID=91928 RepID=A0A0D2CCJ6_9EURO|nr:uncharacterized protein PV08_01804 [Exophiala spinifera]KIW21224.1 hypothetical protein PV08_01804 [Exophiala spinifera]